MAGPVERVHGRVICSRPDFPEFDDYARATLTFRSGAIGGFEGGLHAPLGGGTCQISGTLHGAAFFAGLPMVERYPHSRPSYYIKLGLDATVVYPTINFRFKNGFDVPNGRMLAPTRPYLSFVVAGATDYGAAVWPGVVNPQLRWATRPAELAVVRLRTWA